MRTILALAVLAASLGTATAQSFESAADQPAAAVNDRLLIVNGHSGRVIYDDGRDDLFCVTRRAVVGYDDWGYPVRRRTMHCR